MVDIEIARKAAEIAKKELRGEITPQEAERQRKEYGIMQVKPSIPTAKPTPTPTPTVTPSPISILPTKPAPIPSKIAKKLEKPKMSLVSTLPMGEQVTATLQQTTPSIIYKTLPRAKFRPKEMVGIVTAKPKYKSEPSIAQALGIKIKPEPKPEIKEMPYWLGEQLKVMKKEAKPEQVGIGLTKKVAEWLQYEPGVSVIPAKATTPQIIQRKIEEFGKGIVVGAAGLIEMPFTFIQKPVETITSYPKGIVTTIKRFMTGEEAAVTGETIGTILVSYGVGKVGGKVKQLVFKKDSKIVLGKSEQITKGKTTLSVREGKVIDKPTGKEVAKVEVSSRSLERPTKIEIRPGVWKEFKKGSIEQHTIKITPAKGKTFILKGYGKTGEIKSLIQGTMQKPQGAFTWRKGGSISEVKVARAKPSFWEKITGRKITKGRGLAEYKTLEVRPSKPIIDTTGKYRIPLEYKGTAKIYKAPGMEKYWGYKIEPIKKPGIVIKPKTTPRPILKELTEAYAKPIITTKPAVEMGVKTFLKPSARGISKTLPITALSLVKPKIEKPSVQIVGKDYYKQLEREGYIVKRPKVKIVEKPKLPGPPSIFPIYPKPKEEEIYTKAYAKPVEPPPMPKVFPKVAKEEEVYWSKVGTIKPKPTKRKRVIRIREEERFYPELLVETAVMRDIRKKMRQRLAVMEKKKLEEVVITKPDLIQQVGRTLAVSPMQDIVQTQRMAQFQKQAQKTMQVPRLGKPTTRVTQIPPGWLIPFGYRPKRRRKKAVKIPKRVGMPGYYEKFWPTGLMNVLGFKKSKRRRK